MDIKKMLNENKIEDTEIEELDEGKWLNTGALVLLSSRIKTKLKDKELKVIANNQKNLSYMLIGIYNQLSKEIKG